jgi:hypothetical protein
MREREKIETVVLGGCIENQRPSDKSEGCNCFQVSMSICYKFKVYRVTICREWARYMACNRVPVYGHRTETAWGEVVTNAIKDHFSIIPVTQLRGIYIRSKTLYNIVQPLGYFPSYFREVVMYNRYGYLVNQIPLTEIAERVYYDVYKPEERLPDHYEHHWELAHNKWDETSIGYNEQELKKFRRVLARIMAHGKSIKYMNDSVKKNYNEKEDFAAVLLHLSAMEAKAQLKTQTTNGAD